MEVDPRGYVNINDLRRLGRPLSLTTAHEIAEAAGTAALAVVPRSTTKYRKDVRFTDSLGMWRQIYRKSLKPWLPHSFVCVVELCQYADMKQLSEARILIGWYETMVIQTIIDALNTINAHARDSTMVCSYWTIDRS